MIGSLTVSLSAWSLTLWQSLSFSLSLFQRIPRQYLSLTPSHSVRISLTLFDNISLFPRLPAQSLSLRTPWHLPVVSLTLTISLSLSPSLSTLYFYAFRWNPSRFPFFFDWYDFSPDSIPRDHEEHMPFTITINTGNWNFQWRYRRHFQQKLLSTRISRDVRRFLAVFRPHFSSHFRLFWKNTHLQLQYLEWNCNSHVGIVDIFNRNWLTNFPGIKDLSGFPNLSDSLISSPIYFQDIIFSLSFPALSLKYTYQGRPSKFSRDAYWKWGK